MSQQSTDLGIEVKVSAEKVCEIGARKPILPLKMKAVQNLLLPGLSTYRLGMVRKIT